MIRIASSKTGPEEVAALVQADAAEFDSATYFHFSVETIQ